jgi:hypothetical protein
MQNMITKVEGQYEKFFENWDGDIHKIREIDGFVGDLVGSMAGSEPARKVRGTGRGR